MNRIQPKKLFSAELAMMKLRGGDAPEAVAAISRPGDVSVDNSEVLEAIRALGAEMKSALKSLKAPPPDNMPEINTLRGQLKVLGNHIEETKKEIAAVSHPGGGDDKLTSAAQELGAIVDSTEKATHKILNATEEIEEHIQHIKERVSDVKSIDMLNEITNLGTSIFEACNFQDINGQRTSKVVKIINFMEEKINRMIEIWGADQFEGIDVADDKDEDTRLLEGPQMQGQGISQSEIDSLFD
jgi:chemotaxis protein CheZ